MSKQPPIRPSLCFVATVPYAVNAFLKGHLTALGEVFPVTLITGNDDTLAPLDLPPSIRVVRLPLQRRPSPLRDLFATLTLWQHFRRNHYFCVLTITPKAGLIGMLAAWLAGVPHRFHYFTGQVWATRTGAARMLLKGCDKLMAALATRVYADGAAQMNFLVAEGVVTAEEVSLLGPGPVCGVDIQRFRPDAERRAAVRQAHGITDSVVVILFVGRLHREKGMHELVAAFSKLLQTTRQELCLLVVGPNDDAEGRAALENAPEYERSYMRITGGVRDPESYMAAADVFVLPSHREGFGMVVLEAAACGVPAVVSDIYGLSDAVEENITALKTPVSDSAGLESALRQLVEDEVLRKRMAEAGLRRVREKFTASAITAAWLDVFYVLAAAHEEP